MSYSAEKWANVRYDYESGNLTIEKLSKKWQISTTAIVNKMQEEEWVKGKHKETIQQTVAEKNINMFANLNCTPERVAQRVIEGIFMGDELVKKLAEHIKEIREPSKDEEKEKSDTLFYETIYDLIKQIGDNKKISKDYIQEYNKMLTY
jgi:hypothetical protein